MKIDSTDLRRASVAEWHDVDITSTARLTTLSSPTLPLVSKVRIGSVAYDGLSPPGTIDDETNLLILRHSTATFSTRKSATWIQGRSRHDGTFNFEAVSPAQITSDQNNYQLPVHPNDRFIVRLSTDASRTITGFDIALADSAEVNEAIMIINVGSNDLVLADQSASSTAANRIISPTGANYTLNADESCLLWYDDTTSRWRILSGTGA